MFGGAYFGQTRFGAAILWLFTTTPSATITTFNSELTTCTTFNSEIATVTTWEDMT